MTSISPGNHRGFLVILSSTPVPGVVELQWIAFCGAKKIHNKSPLPFCLQNRNIVVCSCITKTHSLFEACQNLILGINLVLVDSLYAEFPNSH